MFSGWCWHARTQRPTRTPRTTGKPAPSYGVTNINTCIDKTTTGNITRLLKVADLENIYTLYMYKANKIKILKTTRNGTIMNMEILLFFLYLS